MACVWRSCVRWHLCVYPPTHRLVYSGIPVLSHPYLLSSTPFYTAQADLEPSDSPVSILMYVTSPVLWEFDPRALCRLLVDLYPQPASFLQKVRSPSVIQILAQGIILHQLSKWLELCVPVSIHSCSSFYFYFALKFTALEHSCFVIVWLVVFCSARNGT